MTTIGITENEDCTENIACASRMSRFSSGPSLWDEYQILAKKYNPCNLGSGFPNLPLDLTLKSELHSAAESPHTSWYPRAQGCPGLCNEVSEMYSPSLGRQIDPLSEIIVTAGAYQGIFWFFESYTQEGDEVIVFDPSFDAYVEVCALTGAKIVPVSLKITEQNSWELDKELLSNSFTSRSKLIVVNTPHNPTGKVFSREELEFIAGLSKKHNCLVLSDEVYEKTLLPRYTHVSIASLPGMWDRTVTICSASKLFAVTGWRIGWAYGPSQFIEKMYSVCKCDNHGVPTILQVALEGMLKKERLEPENSFITRTNAMYTENQRKLQQAFTDSGMSVLQVEGGMFLLVDCTKRAFHFQTSPQFRDSADKFDAKMSKFIIQYYKLQTLPLSAFYHLDAKSKSCNYLRVCFAKSQETVDKAVEIIKTFK